ncbi:MAG: phosphoribosyltransferase family protein [bacterium]
MELIKNLFKIKIEKLSIDGILGVATGGIAHAMFLNTQFRLPFGYVRLDAKAYGLGKNIEGIDVLWKTIVVIEDTVSTGGSLLDSIKILKDSGASFVYPLCIYSHEMEESKKGFEEAGYILEPLITFTDVIYSEKAKEMISPEEYILLLSWKSNPKDWFEKFKDFFEPETA